MKPAARKEKSVKPLPDTPLVTIVTPSFNTGRFIEETLRSVRDQDYPLVEHIVLDSGSTDQTLEIVARFPSVRLITAAPATVTGKINHGFSIAKGDIVGWLCADDLYLPGAITNAVEALKRNPDAALTYCNFILVDEHGVEFKRWRGKQATLRNLLDEENQIPTEGAFIRREALERVGPVDTRYSLVPDWDLWIRISEIFPIHHVDDWWAAFRVHSKQRSNRHQYEFWLEARRMTRAHGARFFSRLFWLNFWARKVLHAAMLLCTGQLRVFNAKLRNLLVSVSAGRPRE
jgi:glycosyltransferase involved in cell wall biosynthesis